MHLDELMLIGLLCGLLTTLASFAADGLSAPGTTGSAPRPDRLAVKAVFKAAAAIEYAPAAVNSVGYVVTHDVKAADGDADKGPVGAVQAVSLNTGQVAWRFTFPGRAAGAPVATMRSVLVTTIAGDVYAVDRLTGKQAWHYSTGERLYCPVRPAEPQGCECRNIYSKIIVATGEGNVLCLDSRTGKKLWLSPGATRINAPASPWKDKLLLADCDGLLRGLELEDGKQAFSVELPGPVGGSPLVVGNLAIVATATGAAAAVDLEARKLAWKDETLADGAVIELSAALAGDMAVIGGDDMCVHALRVRDGNRRWVFEAADAISATALAVTGGVFAADASGTLYLLGESDGKAAWRYDAGNEICGMAAIKNGFIFTTTDGALRVCRW